MEPGGKLEHTGFGSLNFCVRGTPTAGGDDCRDDIDDDTEHAAWKGEEEGKREKNTHTKTRKTNRPSFNNKPETVTMSDVRSKTSRVRTERREKDNKKPKTTTTRQSEQNTQRINSSTLPLGTGGGEERGGGEEN